MIAQIDTDYISKQNPAWVAELVATIAKGNHIIECDHDAQLFIEQCVSLHCSTLDKEMIFNASLYDITDIKRQFLTTIPVNGRLDFKDYLRLFGLQSLVIVENGPYEWPVYKCMIDSYKHDRRFKTIFTILHKAVNGPERSLQDFGVGGNGGIVMNMDYKETQTEYCGITRYKIYTVTDSDLEAPDAEYMPTPRTIFQYLSGPKYQNSPVDRNLIDTLHQPHYHWHMWRKRTIENYFGPDEYDNLGMDAEDYRNIPVPDRYFQKVEKKMKRYDKSRLSDVAKSMSRDKYEAICDKLTIDGMELSEIQLFLLKMAKVV